MEIGDVTRVDGKRATVVAAVPDMNGEIVVQTEDGYYVPINPDSLEPDRATYRADTPHGQVTIDLPVDGIAEVRAVWSNAAVERVAET